MPDKKYLMPHASARYTVAGAMQVMLVVLNVHSSSLEPLQVNESWLMRLFTFSVKDHL